MKQLITEICGSILRPLASVLLRCGMTWKEFSDVSKRAFVDVATHEFGIRGRPTNVSRVSILTGIQRKEVKRLRDQLAGSAEMIPGKTTDATRLLTGWHLDDQFADRSGNALPLPIIGGSPNFSELFAKYGGDTPEQTMLRELKNAGSIEIDADGNAIAKSRYFMPAALSEPNLRLFGAHLSSHTHTLKNNIVHQSTIAPRFEGAAIDDFIHPDQEEAFNTFINARGQQFLEEVDDWLNQHRLNDSDQAIPVRLGAGVYAINGKS